MNIWVHMVGETPMKIPGFDIVTLAFHCVVFNVTLVKYVIDLQQSLHFVFYFAGKISSKQIYHKLNILPY